MKRIISGLFVAVFYLYFFGGLIAAPIFNWRYANEHGFFSWIIFGEVIATSKSTIWPYYFLKGISHPQDPVISSSALHYNNATHACDTALKLVDSAGGLDAISKEQVGEVIKLLATATDEAKQVDDQYLGVVHKELPKKYREEYVESINQLLEGCRSGNTVMQTLAAIRYNNFAQWMSDHSAELHFPKR